MTDSKYRKTSDRNPIAVQIKVYILIHMAMLVAKVIKEIFHQKAKGSGEVIKASVP